MLLTELQTQTLQAAMSRIIPTDDTPGAAESGAIDYILGQLGHDLKDQLPAYQVGLDALNAEAIDAYQIAFAQLLPGQQDTILSLIEKGEGRTLWSIGSHSFFHLLINHTAEGFYSDPGNGGNRDAISWEIIGF